MTIASPRRTHGPVENRPHRVMQLWAWLTRCDAEGCQERPVHLGWCASHAPAYDPGPDEYWGDPKADQRAV